ncbi:hypothetical protein M0R45_015991 [Rubus argutus]|uniref:Uncharacterized protein n=1 Tax=Rubus argutus TaxID=59490 RepID=A0AAW1XRS0_RUBAR
MYARAHPHRYREAQPSSCSLPVLKLRPTRAHSPAASISPPTAVATQSSSCPCPVLINAVNLTFLPRCCTSVAASSPRPCSSVLLCRHQASHRQAQFTLPCRDAPEPTPSAPHSSLD